MTIDTEATMEALSLMEATPVMETDSAVYKTLLESTKAIPWKIDWQSKCFTYIGPQIENLLGWAPSSWISVDDWAARMHPDDRESVVNFCVSQSQQGIDHEADYRALTKEGRYVWIRDVVHVVRKKSAQLGEGQEQGEGEVEALIGFMFDITERKKNEEQLLQLQKELEDLSYKDGLTGISNRRMFDSILDIEWANAQRHHQPLSMIMLDIDFFKQYNDHYGHVKGDDCLQRVAEILSTAAKRPRDFFARFGGEEFVLILPETDEKSAQKIAERCRLLIREQKIVHEKSSIGQQLTISLGVCTITPQHNTEPREFIDKADRLLYKAKQNGRDRAEYGQQ
jgi:diguanylate cyclase (GGDEF)-like protein/PAS domain S-box-containing protein